METCEVKLTAPRSGPAGSFGRGDPMTVSLLEAGRLIASGGCEKPGAALLKKIEAAQAEADAAAEAARNTAEGAAGVGTLDEPSGAAPENAAETGDDTPASENPAGDDGTEDDAAAEVADTAAKGA